MYTWHPYVLQNTPTRKWMFELLPYHICNLNSSPTICKPSELYFWCVWGGGGCINSLTNFILISSVNYYRKLCLFKLQLFRTWTRYHWRWMIFLPNMKTKMMIFLLLSLTYHRSWSLSTWAQMKWIHHRTLVQFKTDCQILILNYTGVCECSIVKTWKQFN